MSCTICCVKITQDCAANKRNKRNFGSVRSNLEKQLAKSYNDNIITKIAWILPVNVGLYCTVSVAKKFLTSVILLTTLLIVFLTHARLIYFIHSIQQIFWETHDCLQQSYSTGYIFGYTSEDHRCKHHFVSRFLR